MKLDWGDGRPYGGSMKRTYACPLCNTALNPSDKIILRGTHGPSKGLFLFSPKPGNYDARIPPGFTLKRGDEVTFHCPVCSGDLTAPQDREWAALKFHQPSGLQGTVVFSKVFGKRATFFITEETVKPFGEDSGDGGFLKAVNK